MSIKRKGYEAWNEIDRGQPGHPVICRGYYLLESPEWDLPLSLLLSFFFFLRQKACSGPAPEFFLGKAFSLGKYLN